MLSTVRKSYLLWLSCPVIHLLRALTSGNTGHSKVKTIKFELNICMQGEIILGSVSFAVIFHTAAFVHFRDKQGEKQTGYPPPLHANLLKFLTHFFLSPTAINFRKPAKLQSIGTHAAFPSHSMLRDFFPLSTADLLYLSGGEKNILSCAAVSSFLLKIHIFNQEAISQTPNQKTLLLWLNQLSIFFFYLKPDLALCPLASYRLIEIHSSSPRQEKGGEKASHTWKNKTGKWLLEIWKLCSGYSFKDKTSPWATSDKVTTPPLHTRSKVGTIFLTATRNTSLLILSRNRSKHNIYLMLNSQAVDTHTVETVLKIFL